MFDWLRRLGQNNEAKQQERLNAYLDNALSPQERLALEQELSRNSPLQQELVELRWLRAAIRQLPHVPAPRQFTLTPDMVSQRTHPYRTPLYPALRLATTLTAFLLVALLSLELILPVMNAPDSAYESSANADVMSDDAETLAYDGGETASEEAEEPVEPAAAPAADMTQTEAETGNVEIPVPAEEVSVTLSAAAVTATIKSDAAATILAPIPTPSATPSLTPSLTAVPITVSPTSPPISPNPLRLGQIGMGIIFVVLLFATLSQRRRASL
ncbi:MAG: hypothetical protein V9G20_07520 [Candidatus Promineifilaceae bacterium]